MVKRLISSFAGVVVALVVLFLSGTIIFNISISIVCIILTYELLKAKDCLKYTFLAGVCYTFSAVMPFMTQNMSMGWRMSFSLFCVFLLFCGMIRVHTVVTIDNLCYMIATTMLATFSMSCLVTLLRSDDFHGVYYVILCLAGAWMGDSGAFFIGRKFGKHKLAPDISPKKTVEGAVAGVVTVAVVFVGFSFAYQIFCGYVYDVFFTVNLLLVGIMGIACGVLGIIGDLSASVIKRSTGIKDFGNIMPGHGGLMDRFDSVLFVAPFMAMIIQMTSGVVPESNMPKLLFFL